MTDLLPALAERLQITIDCWRRGHNTPIPAEELAREALAFVAEHANRCGLHPQNTASNCVMCIVEGQALILKQYAERLPTREETARLLNANSGTPWDELGQGALSDLFEKADALLRDWRERLGITT